MIRLNNVKTNEWIEKLENYSKSFQTVNMLYLYYKHLCKSTHLIQGKYTNFLYTTPLLKLVFYSPAMILYLPVEYSTMYLEVQTFTPKPRKYTHQKYYLACIK